MGIWVHPMMMVMMTTGRWRSSIQARWRSWKLDVRENRSSSTTTRRSSPRLRSSRTARTASAWTWRPALLHRVPEVGDKCAGKGNNRDPLCGGWREEEVFITRIILNIVLIRILILRCASAQSCPVEKGTKSGLGVGWKKYWGQVKGQGRCPAIFWKCSSVRWIVVRWKRWRRPKYTMTCWSWKISQETIFYPSKTSVLHQSFKLSLTFDIIRDVFNMYGVASHEGQLDASGISKLAPGRHLLLLVNVNSECCCQPILVGFKMTET